MHNSLVAAASLLLASSLAAQRVPVVDLPPASAKSAETIGAVLGVRELSHGSLLVDDAGRRQLRLFDPSLATSVVVLDSVSGSFRSYGRRPAPLFAYLGDSSLFPDYQSRTIVVLDERGQVARTLALPTVTDVGFVGRGAAVDDHGRIIFAGSAPSKKSDKPGELPTMSDSIPILRADLTLRRTDTLGRVARPLGRTAALTADGSATIMMWTVDPLRTLDDWAVLSDGSLALVRGQDYHVDWVRSNGTAMSAPKMPFDWKRVTDEDKQRIIDSTRARLDATIANGSFTDGIEQVEIIRNPPGSVPPRPAGEVSPQGQRGAGGGPTNPFAGLRILPPEVVSADKIAGYYPPLRSGAALADRDGNLWILPRTSTESRQGELIYDVVNSKGELFQRVRVPLGRLIVGFGPGGTVYMTSGDRTSGYVLERSKLPATTR